MQALHTPAPDTAPRAAAQQVFETAELLEMILLELPLRNIFAAQRISKQFNNTISGSTQLQQAMWLQPTPDQKDPVLNPLCSNLAATPNTRPYSGWHLQYSSENFSATKELLNYRVGFMAIQHKPWWPETLYSQDRTGKPQSWRKMILAQNIRSASLSMSLRDTERQNHQLAWKGRNAEEATLGECFDALDVVTQVVEHKREIGSFAHIRFDISNLEQTDDHSG